MRLVLVMLRGSSGDKIVQRARVLPPELFIFMVSKFMVLGHLFVCLLSHKYFQPRSRLDSARVCKNSEGELGVGSAAKDPGTSHEKLPLAPRNMTTRTNH